MSLLRSIKASWSPFESYGAMSVFLGLCGWILLRLCGMSGVGAYFVVINAVTGALFFSDKLLAGSRGIVRVPERLFFIMALLGGSPMILIGQKIFRHKSQKVLFRMTVLAITLIQILIGIALLSDRMVQ